MARRGIWEPVSSHTGLTLTLTLTFAHTLTFIITLALALALALTHAHAHAHSHTHAYTHAHTLTTYNSHPHPHHLQLSPSPSQLTLTLALTLALLAARKLPVPRGEGSTTEGGELGAQDSQHPPQSPRNRPNDSALRAQNRTSQDKPSLDSNGQLSKSVNRATSRFAGRKAHGRSARPADNQSIPISPIAQAEAVRGEIGGLSPARTRVRVRVPNDNKYGDATSSNASPVKM